MPFADTGLSIDMNFESLEGLIGNRGTRVVHELSIPCPCLQVKSGGGAVGSATAGCAECNGRGRVFRDPVLMSGILDSLSNNKIWSQVGWVQPGDVTFSPSTHARRINDFDRVTVTISVPVEGQVITRGQANALVNRPRSLTAQEDLLLYESGRKEAVWVEDENGVVYRPGQYVLDGRRIRWTVGAGPRVGVSYSIKYEAHPEFIAWAAPFDRWDRQRELGQQVMLRKAILGSTVVDEIRPPWREKLQSNEIESRDPRGHYGLLGRTVDPPR